MPIQVRKYVNDHPLGAGTLLLLAVGLCAWLGYSAAVGPSKRGRLYYSSDDGKTFFAGPAQVTPYTQDGKEVDQAMVFACPDQGNKPFVGYLLRYNAQNRAAADKALSGESMAPPPPSEVKKPGEGGWVTGGGVAAGPTVPGASKYADITQVKCPDGKFAILQAPH